MTTDHFTKEEAVALAASITERCYNEQDYDCFIHELLNTAVDAIDKKRGELGQGELGEIIGCFDAAIAEGLYEAIAETEDERLKDLLERRVMHAYHIAILPRAYVDTHPLPAQPAEWMKPHPKCDQACMYACTEGFTKFPTCAAPAQPVNAELVEALGHARVYVEDASVRHYDGTNGSTNRAAAKAFLVRIDAALASAQAQEKKEG